MGGPDDCCNKWILFNGFAMFIHFVRSATVALLLSASVAQAQDAPDAMLRSVTAEIVTLAQQPRGHMNAGKTRQVNEAIEAKIRPMFNFPRMTQSAVGASWASASAEQRSALTREFSTLIVRSYTAALRTYRDEAIEYETPQIASGASKATVRSVVKRGASTRAQIEYDMEKTRAGWKVHDIRHDGVDIVANYRNTFANRIRNDGIDGLIRALAEKNGSQTDHLAQAGQVSRP